MTRLLAVGLLAASACQDKPPAVTAPDPIASAVAAPRSSAAGIDSDPSPLKTWMTANMARPIKTESFDELARALSAAALMAPPRFTDWAAIAARGAAAAQARDIDAVRASCSHCHDKFRASYRQQMRDRPLPF